MNTTMTRVRRFTILDALSLSLLIAVAGSYLIADEELFFREEFLAVSEACERWGDGPLDAEVFRSAEDDEPARAAMACSLLKNQADYVGMHGLEIKRLFGDFTGWFWNERQPSYLIEVAKTKADNSWQILFLHDRDWKVAKIVIHKNCCGEIALPQVGEDR